MFLLESLTIIFFPIIRIFGIPLLTYLPVLLFKLMARHFNHLPKHYFIASFVSSLYFLLKIYLNSIFSNNSMNLKDLIYFIIPWLYLLFIQEFNYNKHSYKLVKVCFYINVTLVLLTPLLAPIAELLKNYYVYYGQIHLVVSNVVDHYADMVYSRPGGLFMHPPWLGLMLYMMGKCLSLNEKKNSLLYLSLSFAAILVSGARTALLIFVFFETLVYIQKEKDIVKKILKSAIALILVAFVTVISYYSNSVIQLSINSFLDSFIYGTETQDYSVSYRQSMLDYLFSNTSFNELLFGGRLTNASLSDVGIEYFDSELVMRVLQFGFIGYLLLFLPLFVFYLRVKNSNTQFSIKIARFLIPFLFISSFTTIVVSNVIFILFISIIIGICESKLVLSENR